MSDDGLFKRDGSEHWYCWVPVSGGGKERKTTGCADRKAARLKRAELEREALDPAYAAANKATTPDACDQFVASRIARGRADGTIHHYGVKLGHIVRLMPHKLARIDAAMCERFLQCRLEEGAAQTTVKKEFRALGATLRHAKRMGLFRGDIEAIIPELDDTYAPRERFLMPLEFVALVGALPPSRAAHVVFIVATGARWGESVRARPGDVSDHMVYLRGTKTEMSAGTVPVPPTMRIALQWALANAHSGYLLGDGPLFASWGNVRRDLAKACASIGIEPVTPNDLRRTFATWLRASGVSTDLIGAALRHTTSRMAELVYGRIKPGDLDKLITERGPALLMSAPEKESPVPGLLMGCDVADIGNNGLVYANPTDGPNVAESPQNTGARERNRTADTGIFNPPGTAANVDGSRNSDLWWAANGITLGGLSRRWSAPVAA